MYRIIGADGKEYGPVSAEQVRQWIAEGRANADTRMSVEGSGEWRTLGTFPEFAYLLAFAPNRGGLAHPTQKSQSLAVASLIMGILSILFTFCCYGLPFNVLGLIFSLISLAQIRGEPERFTGKGMALTGLVLSVISIVLCIILLIAVGLSLHRNEPSHPRYRL